MLPVFSLFCRAESKIHEQQNHLWYLPFSFKLRSDIQVTRVLFFHGNNVAFFCGSSRAVCTNTSAVLSGGSTLASALK